MVTAKLRHLRISPRKVRLVSDAVRGMKADEAVNVLTVMNKKAAKPLLKLLKSALANADHNDKIKSEILYIIDLRVDEGPTIKRWMPRAQGRATPLNKRTSHISLGLGLENEKPTGKKDNSIKKDDSKKEKDKDVKVVKSLDEIKQESVKEETLEKNEKKTEKPENIQEKDDSRRDGADRNAGHIDKVHSKEKGSVSKKIFRRKSV